jgi:hypothetical protein
MGAILAGSLVSVGLFLWSYSAPIRLLYWPQAVGFYACMVIRGVHTATETDFAAIAIPINAAIYSVVILGLLRVLAGKRTSN